jgi:hypothetical protein
VTYTAATVSPSTLVGPDGRSYTLNNAPVGIAYTAVQGPGTTNAKGRDRWGVVTNYGAGDGTRLEAGYTAGQDAGSLRILAPVADLAGSLTGSARSGLRQAQGLDALAALGRLQLGSSLGLGTENYNTAVATAPISLGAQAGSGGAAFWANPLTATLPTQTRLSADALAASGLGRIELASDGAIDLTRSLQLPTGGSLQLVSRGAGGIALDASVTAHGGSFSAETVGALAGSGSIRLASGATLDASGLWVNPLLDATTPTAGTAGGSVALKGAGAVHRARAGGCCAALHAGRAAQRLRPDGRRQADGSRGVRGHR